jgi:hypothetical protein
MRAYLFILIAAVIFTAGWKLIEEAIKSFNHPLRSITEGPASHLPITVNCLDPKYKVLEFESVAVTPLEVAKFRNPSAPALGLVLEQIKFARGYHQLEDSRPQQLIPLSDEGIVIIKEEILSYDSELLLDDVPKLYGAIPQKLINKVVLKKSPALKVTYQLKLKAVLCGDSLAPGAVPPLTLPRDPYLAFWYVPAKDRQLVRFGHSRMVTNPCVHDHAAQLHSPLHYWYVWRPETVRGSFDCQKNLLEGPAVIRPKMRLSDKKMISVDLNFEELRKTDVIQFSQIFGYESSSDPTELSRKALELFSYLDRDDELPADLKRGQDLSSLATYYFIKGLKLQASLNPWKIHKSKSAIELTADGVLRHSDKKIRFQFWLGPTVAHQAGEKHWSFLKNALLQSHVVLYSGHADMGKAFDLGSISATGPKPAYQFIGVLSCFSNSYFEKAVMEFRAGEGMKTDLLLTAYEGYAFKVAPVLVKYLDARLAAKSVSLHQLLSQTFGGSNRISVQRF